MNKRDLIYVTAARSDRSKADVAAIIGQALEVIQETVAAGDKVTIPGFGTFEMSYRPARTARNPQTREPVKVEESWAPKFRPGADFKEVVNAGGKNAKPQQ